MTRQVQLLKQIILSWILSKKFAFLCVIHCAYIALTLAFVVNPVQSIPTNTVVRARFVFALHGFILTLIEKQQTLVDICDVDIIALKFINQRQPVTCILILNTNK